MALIRMVMMLMGIGGLTTRFVRKIRISPTTVFTSSTGNERTPPPANSKAKNNTTNIMSMTNSIKALSLHETLIVLARVL
jgi:hypothetical protein